MQHRLRLSSVAATAMTAVAAAWFLKFVSASAGTSPPPNIVLLLTDDQDLVLSGLDRMPILQRLLAERGVTFANGFVHTPICCPSRTSILSGRYLHNGVATLNSVGGNCYGHQWQADAELRTFAVHAKEAGYRTSYSGKYLNRYGERGTPGCFSNDDAACLGVPPGWDKWYSMVGNTDFYYNTTVVVSDDAGQTSQRIKYGSSYETDYFPDLTTNRTLAIIEEFTTATDENERNKPFLLVNAWGTPHGPQTPAPWASHQFDGTEAPRTPSYNASWEYNSRKHWLVRMHSPITSYNAKVMDQVFEERLESLLSVDEHIGRIVNLLEEKGELANTYIIYTSDNGFHFGQHRLRADKRMLYEHDVRVPFIVVGPRVPQNVVSHRIVLNVDIAPSIYHLVTGESTPPHDMDGASFVPYLWALQEALSDDKTGGGSSTATTTTTTTTSSFTKVRMIEEEGIHDPYPRWDFLISYHGQGSKRCTLFPPRNCGLPPDKFYASDSLNNTYHCIRTIYGNLGVGSNNNGEAIDSIYCRFNDTENFVEYYDLTVDPWQLDNKIDRLDRETRDWFEARLEQLTNCAGESCRNGTGLQLLNLSDMPSNSPSGGSYPSLSGATDIHSSRLHYRLLLITLIMCGLVILFIV